MTENHAAEQAFVKSLCKSSAKPCRHSKAAPMQSVPIPHMAWNGQDFQAQAAAPPPQIPVSVSITNYLDSDRRSHKRPPIPCFLHTQTHVPKPAPAAQEFYRTCGAQQPTLCLPAIASMVSLRSHSKFLEPCLLHIESGGLQTRQVVYIADNIDGFYLSETTMKDLNIITQTFPSHNSSQSASTSLRPVKAPCGCPLQAQPLEHPEQIPFPPLPENREKLENWVLHHYAASAFNTCPHQALHMSL